MTAVLVMIPAGEVYDHDCVRWYDYRNVQKSINHYHNIGDAFVYDAERTRLLSASLAHEGVARAYVYDEAGFAVARGGVPLEWTATGRLRRFGPAQIE